MTFIAQIQKCETIEDRCNLLGEGRPHGDYISVEEGKVYYLDDELPESKLTEDLIKFNTHKNKNKLYAKLYKNICCWLDMFLEKHDVMWEKDARPKVGKLYEQMISNGMEPDEEGKWSISL